MASHFGTPPTATQGPPYPPMVWTLGGAPVKRVDIPAQLVFMILFIIGGIVHMKIFQRNRGRGHKFLPSLFIFFFCMSRVLTSILRIASTCLPRHLQLALATQIFLAAGVLILFVINIIFAMRLVRSTHRSFGWHPAFGIAFRALYVILGITLVLLITAAIQPFFTLDPQTRASDRSMQLYGSFFLAVVATLPLPMVLITLLIPYSPLDAFGTGRLRTKVIVLLISTVLLSLGAWYRCITTWQPLVPRTQPLPTYLGKGAFYIFNFFVEIQTVLMYAILRVDQRYHVPNGAKGPGSYSQLPKPPIGPIVEIKDSNFSCSADASRELLIAYAKEKNSSVNISTETLFTFTAPTNMSTKPHIKPIKKEPPLPLLPPAPTRSRQSSRPTSSRRSSLLQQVLTKTALPPLPTASPEQKAQWRESEDERIVKRLGGPWSRLPSPTESTFSTKTAATNFTHAASQAGSLQPAILSPAKSAFSFVYEGDISPNTGISVDPNPPSLRDTLHEAGDWSPVIDFDLATSPQRFLSLKKRSMTLL